jgi:hypothetical protein
MGEDMRTRSRVNTMRRLFPFVQNGRWGYIDARGKIVVTPTFESANDFSEGLALTWTNEGAGFINESGSMAIVVPYGRKELDSVADFSGGFAWFSIRGKHGCINRKGAIAIEPRFEKVRKFAEGVAAVNVGASPDEAVPRRASGGKWGYIDGTGRMVIQPQFDWAADFSGGVALVGVGHDFLYIDKDGKTVLRPVYESADEKRQIASAGPFSEGLARISTSAYRGPYTGFIEKSGRFVIEPRFEWARDFSEGLAAVGVGNKCGYVDRIGRLMIRPGFDDAGSFREGLARVRIGSYWGYIDMKGRLSIWSWERACTGGIRKSRVIGFSDAEDFLEGLARVHIGGEFRVARDGPAGWHGGGWYYINACGENIRRCRGDEETGPGLGSESR